MRGAFFQIMLKSHIPTLSKKATILNLFTGLVTKFSTLIFKIRPSTKPFKRQKDLFAYWKQKFCIKDFAQSPV